ncbi:MAG: hypothetical protein IT175_06160 [Acidobacteria bacterium]|nr:hypothetical protein [Acidobacteriota bacterium]
MEIKIGGRSYPIEGVKALTWKERRELKRLTGMTPAEFDEVFEQGDPDAWYGYVLVNIRRTDPTFPDDGLDDTNFDEAIGSWVASLKEPDEGDAVPPDGSPPNGNGGTEPEPTGSSAGS